MGLSVRRKTGNAGVVQSSIKEVLFIFARVLQDYFMVSVASTAMIILNLIVIVEQDEIIYLN